MKKCAANITPAYADRQSQRPTFCNNEALPGEGTLCRAHEDIALARLAAWKRGATKWPDGSKKQ